MHPLSNRFFTLICLLSVGFAKAQHCNYKRNGGSRLDTRLVEALSNARLEAATDTIPVLAHILRNSKGQFLDTNIIKQNFKEANTLFATINIYFKLNPKFHFIDSDEFYDLDKGDEPDRLTKQGLNTTMVNVFYVNTVYTKGTCGFMSRQSGTTGVGNTIYMEDYIMIQNGCLTRNLLAHELGHYLDLDHTHEDGVQELVDGSNCKTAGDLFCDTPADPDLSEKVNLSTCQYTGTVLDPKGQAYRPDVANIMSYAPDKCVSRFSAEQYAHMSAYYAQMLKNRLHFDHRTNLNMVIDYVNAPKTFSRDVARKYPLMVQNTTMVAYNGSLTYKIEYLNPKSNVWSLFTTGTLSMQLTAFDTDTVQLSLLAPAEINDGNYHFKFVLDPQNAINEATETDNEELLYDVSISGTKPQQVDYELIAGISETPYIGQSIKVGATVTNIGSINSTDTGISMDVVLSGDSITSSDDISFNTFSSGFDFKMGVPNKTSTSLALFPKEGLQYVILTVKSSTYQESNTANNKVIIPINVQKQELPFSQQIDLKVTDLKVTNTTEKVYEFFYGDYLISSLNSAADGRFNAVATIPAAFYLSKDASYSADDILLSISVLGNVPPSGNAVKQYMNALISKPVPTGNYYLIMEVDHYRMLKDRDMSNNYASCPVTITNGTIGDIAITKVTTAKNRLNINDSLKVEIETTNLGFAPIEDYLLTVDLRTKSIFGDSAYFVGGGFANTPSPIGKKTTYKMAMKIDGSIPPGIYYLVPEIIVFSGTEFDGNNKLPETIIYIGTTPTSLVPEASQEEETLLYPNPATSVLVVKHYALQSTYTISSITGNTLQESVIDRGEIDVSDLQAGTYLLHVNGYKPRLFVKK